MDMGRQKEFLQKAKCIAELPESEQKHYKIEQLIHEYCSVHDNLTRTFISSFAETFFPKPIARIILDALRPGAYYPDKMVIANQVIRDYATDLAYLKDK